MSPGLTLGSMFATTARLDPETEHLFAAFLDLFIPTVIEDGVDGLLVEKEDVGQLAATLAHLINDVALRRRLGEAARERVQREFSGEVYVEHYAELVSSALKRRGA